MRSASDEVLAMMKSPVKSPEVVVRSSFDYGSIFLLQQCLQDLHLDHYLNELLSETEVAMVTALAFNRLLRPRQ